VDPDAIWDGELGRSRDGCIRWGCDRRRGRGSLGVNFGRPTVRGFKIVEFEFRVRVRVSSNFFTFDKYQNGRVV